MCFVKIPYIVETGSPYIRLVLAPNITSFLNDNVGQS